MKYTNELYIGFTSDLKKRLVQHNSGEGIFTKRYMPWKLFYYEAFSNENMARKRELSLKNNGNPMRELKKRTGIFKKSDKGFTLMETMIYMALFAVLMSGAVIGTYNLLLSSNFNVTSTGIQEEGTFLNRKINWALSGATAVSVSGGGSILTVTRPDLGAESPLSLSGTSTKMTIARGTGSALQLNSDRFDIHNVVFTYVPSLNGKPASVYVSFLVKDKPFTFKNYLR